MVPWNHVARWTRYAYKCVWENNFQLLEFCNQRLSLLSDQFGVSPLWAESWSRFWTASSKLSTHGPYIWEMSERSSESSHHVGLQTVQDGGWKSPHPVSCLSQSSDGYKNWERFLAGLYEPLRYWEEISFHWKDSRYSPSQRSSMRLRGQWYLLSKQG